MIKKLLGILFLLVLVVGFTVPGVLAAPPVVNPDTYTTNEDTSTTFTPLENDNDPDGTALSITTYTNPTKGTISKNGNSFTYTPNLNTNGQDQFTYTVNDGNGDSGTSTITINVNPVNDAPTSSDLSVTTTEDVSLTSIMPVTEDIEGDSVDVSLVSSSKTSHGTVTRNADKKSFTYVPDVNYFGPDSFQFKVDDGTAVSEIYAVTIAIDEVNDAPTFSPLVKEVLISQTTFTVDLDTYASDGAETPKSSLMYTVTDTTTGDINADKITCTPSGTRQQTLTCSLNTGVAVNDANVFNIQVRDTGDSNGASQETPDFDFKISILAPQPQAVDDSASTNKNSVVTVDVLRNDVVAQTGDTLTLVTDGFQTTSNEGGRVELVAATSTTTAKLKFTPKTDFIGTDRFTYKIRDNNGIEKTATVTVTVTDPTANLSDFEKSYTDYNDKFNTFEDDYFDVKRDYERAVERDDERDAEKFEEDLQDISDDLDKLLDDVNDLDKDIEREDDSQWDDLESDTEDLVDDIEAVQDRIERLLSGEDDTAAFVVDTPRTTAPPASAPSTVVIQDLPVDALANVGPIEPVTQEEDNSLIWLLVGIAAVIAVIIFLVVVLLRL